MDKYTSLKQIMSDLIKVYQTGGMDAVLKKAEEMNASKETIEEIKKSHELINRHYKNYDDLQTSHSVGKKTSEWLHKTINTLGNSAKHNYDEQ